MCDEELSTTISAVPRATQETQAFTAANGSKFAPCHTGEATWCQEKGPHRLRFWLEGREYGIVMWRTDGRPVNNRVLASIWRGFYHFEPGEGPERPLVKAAAGPGLPARAVVALSPDFDRLPPA
jgi:hypothetical protein